MKIDVQTGDGKHLRIPIPTGLVFSRLTAGVAAKKLKEYGLVITKRQAAALIKELNRYRRNHPEWVLVEVQSADGTHVQIKLS